MILPLVAMAAGFLAVAFGLLFRALSSRGDSPAQDREWLEDSGIEARYAPMARLLNQADYDFLAKLPGYEPSIGRELRAERRKVFTGYLRILVSDFNNLLDLAKLMLVNSAEDQPEFAKSLLREQFRFYFLICAVYCKATLPGFSLGQAQLDELVGSVGRMHGRLRLAAAAA
jgi:hypothetical protein